MKAPCYKCTQRSAVCHAQCVAYHDWVKDRATQSKEIAKRKQMDMNATTFLVEHGKRQRQDSLRRSQEKRR